MVTPTSIQKDRVTQITPVDVTRVRDAGMRALILLAASLGWNVIQRINNPIMLVARDGTQRRLPTNTSIRMSVFQSALSQIMVHTEDREATTELIDAIVKETKLDRDHERRFRLAIGDTLEDHRARLANEKAAEQKRTPDEHLTFQPEVSDVGMASTPGFGEPEVQAHDGLNHGRLLSREPFRAHHHADPKKAMFYVSDTSYERVWEDGYKDYECMECGYLGKSPRGIGAHSQVHKRDAKLEPAWKRATVRGVDPEWQRTPRKSAIPKVEDLVFEKPPDEKPDAVTIAVMAEAAHLPDRSEDTASAEEIVDQIAALVAPTWRQRALEAEAEVERLRIELDETTNKLSNLQDDWDALKGLIGGR